MLETIQADVVVIGAGPGGYVAAIRLAQLGKQVIVVEKEAVGGVCLNWGCIPSKALIHAASLAEQIRHADEMGIIAGDVQVDMARMQAWKSGIVQKLTGGIRQLLKTHKIQLIEGAARFEDANTLTVEANGTQTTLQPQHVILATGSVPIEIPGFAMDGQRILESRHALELTEVPKRLGIIGGGVIGLEMGSLFAKLGSQVTIIEKMPSLLPGVDDDILSMLRRVLKKRGVTVHTEATAKSATPDGDNGLKVDITTSKGDETIVVDKLLMSIGRKPSTAGLNLDKAGIQVTERGFIQADNQLRTSNPKVFAIGDVAGGLLLAHKASKEGLIAAAVIAGQNECVDYRALPSAIFCDPEIATVGLSESQATEKGLNVTIGKFPFQASGRALSMNETTGFVKVIADAETDRILGVQAIGPHVAELIAEATLAIEMGATSEDLALTIHTHPTLSESLMEAAEAVHQQAIHIYQKPVEQHH